MRTRKRLRAPLWLAIDQADHGRAAGTRADDFVAPSLDSCSGASSGGPPDFRPARSKSNIALKGGSINNSPRPTSTKEKPAALT